MRKITVTVVLAKPEGAIEVGLRLPAGATVADALALAAANGLADTVAESAAVGVFGKRVGRGYALKDGDRVEIYRPLIADPMETRRRRVKSRAARKLQARRSS